MSEQQAEIDGQYERSVHGTVMPRGWRASHKQSVGTLMAHHWNEVGRIQRAAAAVGFGLPPEKYATPYTQHTSVVNNYFPPVEPPQPAPPGAAPSGEQPKPSQRVEQPAVTRRWPWVWAAAVAASLGVAVAGWFFGHSTVDRTRDVDLGIDVKYEPPGTNP
jgi:hypothetical protein